MNAYAIHSGTFSFTENRTEDPTVDSIVASVEELHRSVFKTGKGRVKESLASCDVKTLDAVLSTLITKEIAEEKKGIFDCCLALVNEKQANALLKSKCEKMESVMQLAEDLSVAWPVEGMSDEARTLKREISVAYDFIKDFVPNLINTFLTAFSLFNIGKAPRTAWEANSMLDVYYKFLMIPATLVVILTAVLPIITWQAYLIGVGVVGLLAVALYAYIRWIRPCPNHISAGDNLTERAKLSLLPPVVGRTEEIDALAGKIKNWGVNNERNSILLHGPTGIGKSAIINGLAQKFFDDKDHRHRTVFSIRTPALLEESMYGGVDGTLKALFQSVKGHKGVVLVFEEIHVFVEKKGTAAARTFSLAMDPDIPCIGLTTTEEYEKYIKKDKPFGARFSTIVPICSMSENNVLEVLTESSANSDILIDESALKSVVKLSDPNCQPMSAVQSLKNVVDDCRSSFENYPISNEFKKKKAEFQSHKKKNLIGSYGETASSDIQQINKTLDIKKELAGLEEQNDQIKEIVSQFRQRVKHYNQMRRSLQTLAEKAVHTKRSFPYNAALRKVFENYYYAIPELRKCIDQQEQQLKTYGIKPRLSKEIVEALLQKTEQGVIGV